jgi:hypothetical protein
LHVCYGFFKLRWVSEKTKLTAFETMPPLTEHRIKSGRCSTASLVGVQRRIVNRLQAISKGAPNYWDFRDVSEDLASKCFFQYPAMMVPAMQKQVAAAILKVRPEVTTIADPFLGSGTILALTMLAGRAFIGQDINPLAILIAKTRAFALDHPYLTHAVKRIRDFAQSDSSTCYDIKFPRQTKWFTRGASIGLSRLRRAIVFEYNIDARRFLWVCLAETIRLNSNSRTSTYKLHVRPEGERNATIEDVTRSFSEIAERNLKVVAEFRASLQKAGLLRDDGSYKYEIKLSYGDTAMQFPPSGLDAKPSYQVVITSPPYGDNKTTVPYGQAAWLPLQWIDLKDIDETIPCEAASGYYDVDNKSLGGTRPRVFKDRQEALEKLGPITKGYIKTVGSVSRGGLSRFVNFAFDLKNAITQFATNCADSGYIVMTLGHRNICGTVCPLNDICIEMLASHNVSDVLRITRQIPSKRMPGKNGHSFTINQEYITVFNKATSKPQPTAR